MGGDIGEKGKAMDSMANAPVYLPTAEDYNALVDFRRWHVPGPAPLYLTLDDIVYLEYYQPVSGFAINLNMRVLVPGGEVVPVSYSYSGLGTTAGTTAGTRLIPGVEGYLLSATVISTAQSRGQCFVRLSVRRGYGAQDLSNPMILCQGYASQYEYVCWPNGWIESPLDGRGLSRTVVGAAPAAGAEISITVPAGVNWILRSMAFTLTTAAGGSNRQEHLVLDDGANVFWAGVSAAPQAGSAVDYVSWAAGAAPASDATPAIQGTLPAECRMRPGWRIRTATTGIQAGDQYSAPTLLVEEFVPGN
jgi:hypothetical protein